MINVTGLKTLVKKAKTFEIKNRAFARLTKVVPREDITYLVSPDNTERDCFSEIKRGKKIWIRNSYYDLIHIKGAGVIPVPVLQELLGDEYRKYCKGIKMSYRKEYCYPGNIYYPLNDLARKLLNANKEYTQKEIFEEFYKVFRKVRKKFILPLNEIPWQWNKFMETYNTWKEQQIKDAKLKEEACNQCKCKNCKGSCLNKTCYYCDSVGNRKRTQCSLFR